MTILSTLSWWEIGAICAGLLVAFAIGHYAGFREGRQVERKRIIEQAQRRTGPQRTNGRKRTTFSGARHG